jgi:hypothetical protein
VDVGVQIDDEQRIVRRGAMVGAGSVFERVINGRQILLAQLIGLATASIAMRR